jgi:hypothetical protein
MNGQIFQMPSKSQIILDDINFVFSEDTRLRCLGTTDLFKEDFDYIDLPTQGQVWISREATKRLSNIAKELGLRSGLLARVEHRTLYDVVSDAIVKRIYSNRDELDISKIDRAMNYAAKCLKRRCVNLVHFIPCHLTWTEDPATLTIGPVTFHNRVSFRRLLLSKMRLQASYETDAHRKFGRELFAETLRFYRKFRWVAEVEVKGFDPNTSDKTAERVVTSALDCLHIFLSPQHSAKMQVGGPATNWERRASLCMNEAGELLPSTSGSAVGQGNFADGWSKSLEGGDTSHFFKLFSTAVETVIDPDLKRPLSRRFLDAAQWFGEAVRDQRASTSVVKYVMAIERMMTTDADKEKSDGGEESITSNLAKRVAAICFDPRKPGDREQWRKKITAAYDLRSKLVHGSMSPLDEEAERERWSIGETTAFALLRAIEAFDTIGLESDDLKGEELRDWFGKVIVWADRAEQFDWSGDA